MSIERPATLADLRASGHADRSVSDEVRDNLVARLRTAGRWSPASSASTTPSCRTLERALLAGQDVILLGERGQAKSRIVRRLAELLDAWLPYVEGCELHSSPDRPSDAARPRARWPSAARSTRSRGCTAASGSTRSWPPPTSPSPTCRRRRPDQGRRGPPPVRRGHDPLRAAPADQPRASSPSTSCPTCPSASRSRCSTCSRSATSRSAATRSGSRSTCCWSPRPTRTTTPTAAASSRR